MMTGLSGATKQWSVCVVAAGALALAACGEVEGSPDAGGDDVSDGGGGDVDAMSGGDTTAPSITSTTPADQDDKVSVLSDVQITFDESLEASTVDGAISVWADGFAVRIEVDGSVSYDDGTQTVTFTPVVPLSWSTRYTVEIGAVEDPSGNAFGGATLAFDTYVNPVTRRVNYDSTTGDVSGYTEYQLDANGYRSERLGHDAGEDGVWFNGDDQITSRASSDYDADGNLLERRSYSGAGVDGEWLTTDDVVSRLVAYRYDSELVRTREEQFSGPGTDGDWGTADDERSSYSDYEYTDGQLTRFVRYDGDGTDGEWFTADDEVQLYIDYQYQDDQVTRVAFYNGAGPDDTWFTGDDVVLSYSTTSYDADGFQVQSTAYDGAGTDGEWFTGDDVVRRYVSNDRSPEGLLKEQRVLSGAGTDGEWFTADDTGGLTTYSHTSELLLEQSTGHDGGTDGIPGTSDDEITHYQQTSYDSNGNRTLFRRYNGAGTDSDWMTNDDLIQYEDSHKTDI